MHMPGFPAEEASFWAVFVVAVTACMLPFYISKYYGDYYLAPAHQVWDKDYRTQTPAEVGYGILGVGVRRVSPGPEPPSSFPSRQRPDRRGRGQVLAPAAAMLANTYSQMTVWCQKIPCFLI